MEFLKSTDLYAPPDKKGNSKLIKKNIITKIDIPIEDIFRVEEAIGNTGKVLKNKCVLVISQNQTHILVNHKYQDIVQLIHNSRYKSNTNIGFNYKNRNK